MKSNRLINENSPYLLQHAHNPVDWYPWGEEAMQKAKQDDKPIILSIGYSACHWCHVMERESFENEAIGKFMSDNFVCIKVDREERPDIDQIYMDAIHIMGLNGGWPLNVFLTPDGRPFYGGTYFPPRNWGNLIQQIAHAFKHNRKELEESAAGFKQALNESELEKYGLIHQNNNFSINDLEIIYQTIEKKFDKKHGGVGNAPKFPMPSIYLFLLRYYHLTKNENALKQVELTLQSMAYGGIYDQIGGGFARYSVDGEWFAPHFEKMLYDNGQLISLYAEAYSLTQTDLYKNIVYETIAFVRRELMSKEFGFYSALDADSEGIEGKFYVWTEKEFDEVFDNEEDRKLAKAYFNITAEGNWEHGYNILHVSPQPLSVSLTPNRVREWKEKLFKAREPRIRPSIDDKILCSWNALLLKGLCDAYAVFGESEFLELALKNAQFIQEKMTSGRRLFRNYKNGKATIPAYLEDYSLVIQAYISLYQVSFEEKWLYQANALAQYAIQHFYDHTEELFFYTDDSAEQLIARKKEIFDNVISSSNSIMATNLYFLGILLDNRAYKAMSETMLAKISPLLKKEVRYLANWACLYTYFLTPTVEIAISGEQLFSFAQQIHKRYFPNKVMVGTLHQSKLPLLEMREAKQEKTLIYICRNKTCLLPVSTANEAWEQMVSN
ncbi:MAG: thioredoxin domain-containing protein [Thermoflexibacter sp.]